MKINFTKKEYKVLMDMVCMADWVIHADEVNTVEDDYGNLREKVLSFAKEMDLDDAVDVDIDGNYLLAEDYADDLFDEFDEYCAPIFWNKLASLLAAQLFAKEVGKNECAPMSKAEQLARVAPVINRFLEEFSENGLENVHVDLKAK